MGKWKSHYCNSVYADTYADTIDLNPLIPQAYPAHEILVMCARDGQEVRMRKACDRDQALGRVTVCGWWETETIGLLVDGVLDLGILNKYDVVVILDRSRIHPVYGSLLRAVEQRIGSAYCNTK